MFSDVLRKVDLDISNDNNRLIEARRQNAIYNNTKEQLDIHLRYLEELEEFKHHCSMSIPLKDQEMLEYTKDSIHKLKTVCDFAMSQVKSLSVYQSHFELRPVSDRYDLVFSLYYSSDPQQTLISPNLCPGKCMRQTISMVLQLVSQKLQDIDYSLLDEPMSNAKTNSKENMEETFNLFLELGMGMYIVDQEPSVYSKLPRDEFYVEYTKVPGSKHGASKIKEVKRDVGLVEVLERIG